jgi:hypothetical protein
MNNKLSQNTQSLQACVSGSVFIVYRFKITSKQNNLISGTGSFKVSQKMTDQEKLYFFHQYTNGFYLKKEQFINIEIL